MPWNDAILIVSILLVCPCNFFFNGKVQQSHFIFCVHGIALYCAYMYWICIRLRQGCKGINNCLVIVVHTRLRSIISCLCVWGNFRETITEIKTISEIANKCAQCICTYLIWRATSNQSTLSESRSGNDTNGHVTCGSLNSTFWGAGIASCEKHYKCS